MKFACRLVVYTLLTVLLLIVWLSDWQQQMDEFHRTSDGESNDENNDTDNGNEKKSVTILLWTKYYRGLASSKFVGKILLSQCEFLPCRVEVAKRLNKTADAIVFPWYERPYFEKVPVRSTSKQVWVFESSQHQYNAPRNNYYEEWRGVFNWTMTYREDSDVRMPSEHMNYFPAARRSSNKSLLEAISKKTKMAAWFVTNRQVEHRNKFIDELKDYIAIDIYGPKEKFQCPKSKWSECVKLVSADYKFYLSFENAFAKDYITEKFFTYIGHPIVPVVYGGGNYKKYFPPNSYIDATEFTSAKELGEFLTKLASNNKEYVKYLQWTLHGVWQKVKPQWCNLCEKLLKRSDKESKSYKDIYEWYYDDKVMIDADKLGVPSRSQIDKTFNYSGSFDVKISHEYPIGF